MPLNLSPTQIAFNARGDGKFNKPFKEQVDFFRKKLNLPTEHWDDIIKSAHDRAFIVAGAAKADLLVDLRDAVDRSIVDGKSIQWFKKEFEGIVQKHGWEGWTGADTKAGRDWRTRVIYNTNLSSSYAAGRYQQQMDPDLLKIRPYWKYIHSDTVAHPRELHQSWNGLVLKYDDPWWQSHFPPNGFGCQCRTKSVPASEYKGHPPPDDGAFEKKDRWGNVHTLPNGVDYGWDYAPGSNTTTPLKNIIDQKLIRFPASIGADMWQALKPTLAMENRLSWYKAYDSWSADPVSRGRHHLVGAIQLEVLTAMQQLGKTIPLSAEIIVEDRLVIGAKQHRHEHKQDALSPTEWRQLPELLDSPGAVFYDNISGKIIYILPGNDSASKGAVELDYRVKKSDVRLNGVVSGYKQSVQQIDERIKRGDWIKLL